MPAQRKYDVVVYGATGFTGTLCAVYLSAHPQSPRWALGGRNQTRLQKLRSSLKLSDDVGTVEADSTRYASLLAMAEQTSVVINIAGPYRKNNAIDVVKACVEKGTSYVDLSGETGFNATVIERYHLAAQEKKCIVAPSVGFDSLPFDLTTYLAAQHAKQSGEGDVLTADCGVVIKGGASSGTISSALDMAEGDPAQLACGKPDWLSPVTGTHTSTWYASHYFPHFGKYGALTPFTPHNHRIVNRTWGLMEHEASKERYGKQFQYQDGMILPFRPLAWIVSTFVGMFAVFLGNLAPLRWLIKKSLKENGGPSEKQRLAGFMNVRTLARTKTSASVTTLKAKGDPGYHLTSRMIVETALSIALASDDRSELHPLARKGGVLTPATIGAEAIASRLEKYGGFEVTTESWEARKKR